MRESDHIKAYLRALWERPIDRVLSALDVAALAAMVIVVVDDRQETLLVLAFLAVWLSGHYAIFRRQRVAIAELEGFIEQQTDHAAAARARFRKSQELMPQLLTEMREDLLSEESHLVREFFVASHKHTIYHRGTKRRFRYNADEHEDLANKVAQLAEYGFVTWIGPGEVYRMTEGFVDLLTAQEATDTVC